MIITIDGGVATGKSSLAKDLAEHFNGSYLPTGIAYRALTHYISNQYENKDDIDFNNKEEFQKILSGINLKIIWENKKPIISINNKIYTNDELYNSPLVMQYIGYLSSNNLVRLLADNAFFKFIKTIKSLPLIIEGRDASSHLYKNSYLKIFLTVHADIATKRRLKQLGKERYTVKEFIEMKEKITKRDLIDTTKVGGTLYKVDDAKAIDTTLQTREETLKCAIQLFIKSIN